MSDGLKRLWLPEGRGVQNESSAVKGGKTSAAQQSKWHLWCNGCIYFLTCLVVCCPSELENLR